MRSLPLRLLTACLCFCAPVLLATPAMADSLVGAPVDGTLTSLNGGILVTSAFPSSAVVGPGVEFTGVLHENTFNQTFDVAVDLSANGFTVAITSPMSNANIHDGDLFGITLSGLPSFVEGFTLTSYACTGNFVCGLSPENVSDLASNTFSSSAVTLDFSALAAGQVYTFTDVTSAAPTPEPSTLALLGTGVLGAAGVIRRRLVRS
jgi:hypothetical protein